MLLQAFNEPLEFGEVPDPQISRPDDVLIRVAAAGVCGSDIHLTDGSTVDVIGAPTFPYILGHENAGWVEEVGSAVEGMNPGDPVLLFPIITCGRCSACRMGRDGHCAVGRLPGIDGSSQGGFAEYMVTSQRAVIRLPEGTDPAPFSPLADAGVTGIHAVNKAVGSLGWRSSAVVIGVGGVGGFVVELLKTGSPAKVIAIELSQERAERALSLGADVAIVAGENAVLEALATTGGGGADWVFDCFGDDRTVATALAVVRRGGDVCIVGAGGGHISLTAMEATARELTIHGSYVGAYEELVDLVDLYVAGRVSLAEARYPLAEANRALADLHAGAVVGRAVLVP